MTDELIRGTAWLAMAGLGTSAAVALRTASGRSAAEEKTGRWLWTAACAMLWIHVACAFQFQHHWSHAEAYAHTARRTAELVGLDWGGGLYFNYLLLLTWAGDAGWWWIGPQSYRHRPVLVGRLVDGFVAFIAVNATVVFGSGPLRWLALGVILGLGVWALWGRRRA